MNSVIITLGLLLAIAAVTDAATAVELPPGFISFKLNLDLSTDECVCVSAHFGCDGIKSRKKLVQTGLCNKRCCKESNPGEKRECKCMHAMSCPDEYPDENGDCSHLVSCCPDRTMRKQDL